MQTRLKAKTIQLKILRLNCKFIAFLFELGLGNLRMLVILHLRERISDGRRMLETLLRVNI
jgi:hypothetical protein